MFCFGGGKAPSKDTRKSGWLLGHFRFPDPGRFLYISGLNPGIHSLLIGALFFQAFVFRLRFDKMEAPRGALRQYNAGELESLTQAGLEALLMQV